MKSFVCLAASTVCLVLPARAPAAVERTETLQDEARLARIDGRATVVVDNVWGSITVRGTSGETVEWTVLRTTRAETARAADRAEDEVALLVTVEEGRIELYVDGPFRCRDRWGDRRSRRRGADYVVRCDFEIRVPADVDLELSTVNDGDIDVHDAGGAFSVDNVNGGIDMQGLLGSGRATTVNGDVRLRFDRAPDSDCRFESLNGEIRLTFAPGLSADFHLTTFNGEVFSEFPVRYLPSVCSAVRERDGKTVRWKLESITAVRVGSGGPVIRLDGFNGDMFILRHT